MVGDLSAAPFYEGKVLRLFVQEFKKAYNREPRVGAIYGYMSAQFIAAGYQKAGKVNADALIKALEGIREK